MNALAGPHMMALLKSRIAAAIIYKIIDRVSESKLIYCSSHFDFELLCEAQRDKIVFL